MNRIRRAFLPLACSLLATAALADEVLFIAGDEQRMAHASLLAFLETELDGVHDLQGQVLQRSKGGRVKLMKRALAIERRAKEKIEQKKSLLS